MSPYMTGVVVAIVVVTSLLGLLTFAQEPAAVTADANIAELDNAALLKLAQDTAAKDRLSAILQLGETTGDLSVTVPVLAKLTMDRDELAKSAASIALNKIGPVGAPHVRALLESADPLEVAAACTAVKELGGAEMYLTVFKKWLTSADVQVRKRALYALQGANEDAVEVMPLLREALADSDFNNQCMACRVLEKLGPHAMDAEQEILDLYKNGNPSTRSWAAIVLGSMGPTDKTDTAQMLANNLNTFTMMEKQRTLMGLAHLGPEAMRVVEEVRDAMNDESKHVMPHAAYALWRITGDATESIATMEKMLDDPSYADDTVELAGKMQAAAAPLVEKITRGLSNPEESSRELAVVALGNIGPAAASALPAIKSLLSDEDALIRYAAKEAIKQIEGESESKSGR